MLLASDFNFDFSLQCKIAFFKKKKVETFSTVKN